MKMFLTAVLVIGFCGIASADGNRSWAFLEGEADFERDFEQTCTITPEALVRITHTLGDLEVTAWDGKEVRVEARIEVKGNRAEEFGNLIRIDVEEGKNALEITTRFPEKERDDEWEGISCAVALKVRLPPGHSLEVTSSFGTVSIRGMRGSVSVTAAMGDIDIGDVRGKVTLTTSLGKVTVNDCEGGCKVDGHSSEMTFAGIRGDLAIENALGHVDITDADGSIRVMSTNGNIKARGLSYVNKRTGKGNSFHMTLSNGLIEVALPDPPSFNLTATLVFGSIDSDFKLSNVMKAPNTEVCFSRFGKCRANVNLITTNADIRIKKEKGRK